MCVCICVGICGQLPLLSLVVLYCMTRTHKITVSTNHSFDFHTPMVLVFVPRVIPYNRHPNQALLGLRAAAAAATTTCSTPSLAGTLLLLHSKPCWDTAPEPPLPPTNKNEPRTLLLCCCGLVAALQLLKTHGLRMFLVLPYE